MVSTQRFLTVQLGGPTIDLLYMYLTISHFQTLRILYFIQHALDPSSHGDSVTMWAGHIR